MQAMISHSEAPRADFRAGSRQFSAPGAVSDSFMNFRDTALFWAGIREDVMKTFEYAAPEILEEALALLQTPGTEALAGGTDLLGELKRRIRRPERLVNIKLLPKLGGVDSDGGLRIGALASLGELENNPVVAEKFPILAQAVAAVGTPQLRNMGTAGGNLCQHPRCWYFRNRLFPCWLKGGKICFAVDGENKYHAILGHSMCHSVHPSDLAPALIALGARVQIAGARGEREMDLEELYAEPTPKRRQTTVLEPGQLIARIEVPPQAPGSRGIYLKSMERKAWSFALVSLALQVRMEDGRVVEPRLVLGGVATIPWRAKKAEEAVSGQIISEEIVDQAAAEALTGSRLLQDNAYKARLVTALMKQAFAAVTA